MLVSNLLMLPTSIVLAANENMNMSDNMTMPCMKMPMNMSMPMSMKATDVPTNIIILQNVTLNIITIQPPIISNA